MRFSAPDHTVKDDHVFYKLSAGELPRPDSDLFPPEHHPPNLGQEKPDPEGQEETIKRLNESIERLKETIAKFKKQLSQSDTTAPIASSSPPAAPSRPKSSTPQFHKNYAIATVTLGMGYLLLNSQLHFLPLSHWGAQLLLATALCAGVGLMVGALIAGCMELNKQGKRNEYWALNISTAIFAAVGCILSTIDFNSPISHLPQIIGSMAPWLQMLLPAMAIVALSIFAGNVGALCDNHANPALKP